MKKSVLTSIAFAFVATGCAAVGANEQQSKQGMMMMDVQKMDANGDGMASRDEFLKFHEAMFEGMKGKNGMIDMQAMQQHCAGMMGMMGGGMQGGQMMQDHHQMGKPAQ